MAATHHNLSQIVAKRKSFQQKSMAATAVAAPHHCRRVEVNPTANPQHDDSSPLSSLVGSGGGRLRAPSHPDGYEKIRRCMGVKEADVISLVFLIWALAANRKLEVGEGVNE